MENDSIFDSNYQSSNSEDLSIGVKKQQAPFPPPPLPPTQITEESNETVGKTMRRENDSMDDFEHLEHESSPSEDSQADLRNIVDGTSVQLIDLPNSSLGDKISDSCVRELTNVTSKLERNILDTSIPADEKILQPVPATPPPSANYEKHENVERDEETEKENNEREKEDDDENDETASSRVLVESAQTLSDIVAKDYPKDQHREEENHHYHHYQIESNKMNQDKSDKHQMDSKAATMAFMETERSVGDFYHSAGQMNIPDKFQHDVDVSRSMENQGDQILRDEEINEREFRDNNVDENVKDDMCALKSNLSHDKNDEKWAVDSGIDDSSVNTTNEKSVSLENNKINVEDEKVRENNRFDATDDFMSNIESSVLPKPQKSPDYDFLAGEMSPNIETKGITTESKSLMDDDTWNVIERPEMRKEIDNKEDAFKAQRDYYDEAPTKPLPPLPKNDNYEEDNIPMHADYERERLHDETFEMSNDFLSSSSGGKTRGQQHSGTETGDSEFESAPEQSPAKTSGRSNNETSSYYTGRKVNADDIAPKEIFADMGLDAWFNPERLNPKVAALIYWRQPEKTGIVFGAILGVLLSLAYFSLISVFAYLSLLTLCGTVGFRIYKTFMQAVQKTSDGHPFKDILEVDLTLPAEKVHGVADVAVAHANAAVAELRRLFLVEDFIDSLKFGVGLWCLTYVGSWFNGMTLIIIGVVALFTLPKVYETNKAQIDQNVALVHGKINELTAKVKAAIPLGKKSEPTKEE